MHERYFSEVFESVSKLHITSYLYCGCIKQLLQ